MARVASQQPPRVRSSPARRTAQATRAKATTRAVTEATTGPKRTITTAARGSGASRSANTRATGVVAAAPSTKPATRTRGAGQANTNTRANAAPTTKPRAPSRLEQPTAASRARAMNTKIMQKSRPSNEAEQNAGNDDDEDELAAAPVTTTVQKRTVVGNNVPAAARPTAASQQKARAVSANTGTAGKPTNGVNRRVASTTARPPSRAKATYASTQPRKVTFADTKDGNKENQPAGKRAMHKAGAVTEHKPITRRVNAGGNGKTQEQPGGPKKSSIKKQPLQPHGAQRLSRDHASRSEPAPQKESVKQQEPNPPTLASPAKKVGIKRPSTSNRRSSKKLEEDDTWFKIVPQNKEPVLASPAKRLPGSPFKESLLGPGRRQPNSGFEILDSDDEDTHRQNQSPIKRPAIRPQLDTLKLDLPATPPPEKTHFLQSPAKRSVARSLFGPVQEVHNAPIALKPNSPMKQSPKKVHLQKPAGANTETLDITFPFGKRSLLHSPAKRSAVNLFGTKSTIGQDLALGTPLKPNREAGSPVPALPHEEQASEEQRKDVDAGDADGEEELEVDDNGQDGQANQLFDIFSKEVEEQEDKEQGKEQFHLQDGSGNVDDNEIDNELAAMEKELRGQQDMPEEGHVGAELSADQEGEDNMIDEQANQDGEIKDVGDEESQGEQDMEAEGGYFHEAVGDGQAEEDGQPVEHQQEVDAQEDQEDLVDEAAASGDEQLGQVTYPSVPHFADYREVSGDSMLEEPLDGTPSRKWSIPATRRETISSDMPIVSQQKEETRIGFTPLVKDLNQWKPVQNAGREYLPSPTPGVFTTVRDRESLEDEEDPDATEDEPEYADDDETVYHGQVGGDGEYTGLANQLEQWHDTSMQRQRSSDARDIFAPARRMSSNPNEAVETGNVEYPSLEVEGAAEEGDVNEEDDIDLGIGSENGDAPHFLDSHIASPASSSPRATSGFSRLRNSLTSLKSSHYNPGSDHENDVSTFNISSPYQDAGVTPTRTFTVKLNDEGDTEHTTTSKYRSSPVPFYRRDAMEDDKENLESPSQETPRSLSLPMSVTPVRRTSQGSPRVIHSVSRVPLKFHEDDIEDDLSLSVPKKRSRHLSLSPLRGASQQAPPAVAEQRLPLQPCDDNRMPDVRLGDSMQKSPIKVQPSAKKARSSSGRRQSQALAQPGVLNGAVVYTEVHTAEGADASTIFVELLTRMGAKCVKQWNWNPRASLANGEDENEARGNKIGVTHVVYKDGGMRTLEKVREANGQVKCVGVAWVLNCERENKWLDEEAYAVDTSYLPRGGAKRRKSMEPRRLSNVRGELVNQGRTPSSTKKRSVSAAASTEDNFTALSPSPLNLRRRRSSRRDSMQWMKTQNPAEENNYNDAGAATTPNERTTTDYSTPEGRGTEDAVTPSYTGIMRKMGAPSPFTPYSPTSFASKLVQQTCPPKQSRQGLFNDSPEPEAANAFQMRLDAARRKSLMWQPKVGSPLAR